MARNLSQTGPRYVLIADMVCSPLSGAKTSLFLPSVDQRYLTPATTVSVELPDTTRTFRLTEVDGESVSPPSPSVAEVEGLTAKLDQLVVDGAAGKRAADQLWVVSWTFQLETEQLERPKSVSAEKPLKSAVTSAGHGSTTEPSSVSPASFRLVTRAWGLTILLETPSDQAHPI